MVQTTVAIPWSCDYNSSLYIPDHQKTDSTPVWFCIKNMYIFLIICYFYHLPRQDWIVDNYGNIYCYFSWIILKFLKLLFMCIVTVTFTCLHGILVDKQATNIDTTLTYLRLCNGQVDTFLQMTIHHGYKYRAFSWKVQTVTMLHVYWCIGEEHLLIVSSWFVCLFWRLLIHLFRNIFNILF